MLFNSLDFLIFLPLVVILYYSIPHAWRWLLLLAASYYFYMCWKAEYIILIVISTGADYLLAKKIFRSDKLSIKKFYLVLSLFINLGLLALFKYYDFFSENVNLVLSQFNILKGLPYFDLLLPVGISFYTFQTLSYTIDVYNGKLEPQDHLGKFAIFVSFFPQLVAGPIERATHLIPQFDNKITFSYSNMVIGLRRILWGLFKKVVVADRAAIIVDYIYLDYENQTGFSLLVASYLFAFQIYCDFSGYSDIAIGSARLLGIDLMENFKTPYFSKSIREFWGRWHISLSTWFRDYVYIPIGGSRVAVSRAYVNLLVVFLISGLWHGANWTFVIWGALHGIYLMGEKLFKSDNAQKKNSKWLSFLRVVLCFHFVLLGWVFFRSVSVSQSGYILFQIMDFSSWQLNFDYFEQKQMHLPIITLPKFITTICMIGLLIIGDIALYYEDFKKKFFKLPIIFRWAVYILLILLIIVIGNHGESEFIYFQF